MSPERLRGSGGQGLRGSPWQRWRAARWQSWLDRRLPAAREQQLGHRQLFILPTRMGWLYLLACLAIFILGTNYQNNLVLLLAFLLGSLFFTTIWLTHRNLHGLQLLGGSAVLTDVGLAAQLPITLKCSHGARAISLTLGDSHLAVAAVDEVPQTVHLPLMAKRRGRLPLGRIKVASTFPLGLFRCWSLPDLALEAWAAPAPQHGLLHDQGEGSHEHSHGHHEIASQIGDFSHLREHQAGDAQSRIAWKQLAQGRGMLVKLFAQPQQQQQLLSLQQAAGSSEEQRLAVLAYWVREYCRQGQPFVLQLGRQQVGPDSGAAYEQQCRWALARFGAER